MDVESRDFKSFQQVPKWWTRFMTLAVVGAFVTAIIALSVGSAALKKANDEDNVNTVTQTPATNSRSPVSTNSASDEDMSDSETDRALPGTPGYSGYTHPPPSRVRSRLDVITHGHVSPDYFYNLQKGIDDAAQALFVDVGYFNSDVPDDEDSVIEHIVNARRALRGGLAVSFVEHTTRLGRALNETAYDMPVMSLLQDQETYDGVNINTYADMGFSHAIAGFVAADRFTQHGATNVLCLIDDRRVFGRQETCNALKTDFNTTGEVTTRDAADELTATNMIEAAVEDNGADGILTFTPELFSIAYDHLKSEGRLCEENLFPNNSNCVVLGTFDETDDILNGVVDGSVAFALDRQHYMLGYMAIVFLQLHRFGAVPGAGHFLLSGPVVIDTAREAQRRLGRDILSGKSIEGKKPEDLKIRFIVHGHISDPFWSQIKNGVRQAARSTKVKIDFRHPDAALTSMDDIIRSHIDMLDEAENDQVDTIVMTLPRNDTALREAMERIVARTGVSIITINSGHRWFRDYPIHAHIGISDFLEGRDVGQRLDEGGNIERVLCVIHEKGNEDVEERCEGLRSRTNLDVVNISSFEDTDFHIGIPNAVDTIKEAVMARLSRGRFQAVVSTGLYATEGVREALAELDVFCKGNAVPDPSSSETCVEFVAYDLDERVFTYILNDEMLFAVDQQPDLQGYLPVFYAMIEALWANRPVGLIRTGPRFVDITNVIEAQTLFGFLASS